MGILDGCMDLPPTFGGDPNSRIDPKYRVARGRGIMIISQDVPVMTGILSAGII